MQSKAYIGPIIEIQCDCEGKHHYYYCLDLFKYTDMKVRQQEVVSLRASSKIKYGAYPVIQEQLLSD